MEFIHESTLAEYISHFWKRERWKHLNDPEALARLDAVADRSEWMRERGKLPSDNSTLGVYRLSRSEVEKLMIPQHIVNDEYMDRYSLMMNPPTAVINDLAKAAVNRGFFNDHRHQDTGQHKRYWEWRRRGTLENAITGDAMTLIRADESGGYVIVDGWGRLLAFVALLIENFDFYPVESFVAS